MESVFAGLLPGVVETRVTRQGEHPSAVWGEMLTNKVVSVSDTAPQPIRDQAHAFRARVLAIAVHYLAEARADTVAHIANELERGGMATAAAYVRNRRAK